jgi:hypothetical protein
MLLGLMSGRVKIATRGAVVALIIVCAAIGLAFPRHMIGVASWSVTVAAVLYGLGAAIGRVVRVELQNSERIVLGTCAWIAITGWLLAAGCASRIPLLVIAAAGLAMTVVELVRRDRGAAVPLSEGGDRSAAIALWIMLTVFLALNLLGMIGSRGNPADDQVAYTAFVKRVLDTGNLIEPFSFRRLSAYGGQTMLHALAGLRGDIGALDLLDRGIFQWIAVSTVLDLARRRRLHFGITVVLIVFLLSLWDLPLNTGPIWTAVTCFLGAYGFASRDDLAPRTRLGLTFLVLGAACTLRQNYLVPAGMFGVLLLVAHLRDVARATSWRRAWITERVTLVASVGVTAFVLVPYMIAAFASSGTLLYPILLGTGNPITPLRPTGGNWLDEVDFFLRVVFVPEPIRVWWLLVPTMLLAKDHRTMRPWRSFLAAGLIGFIALVHSFALSDPWNLWRYAFGFATPIAIVFVIEVAGELPFVESDSRSRFGLPVAATFLVWLALVINIIEARTGMVRRFSVTLRSVQSGWVFGSQKPELPLRTYRALQRSVPEGAPIVAMLDDPWVLDYARNPIFNLDMPGLAAPGPGLPSFTDAAHWRSYFLARGLRYVAFVDPDYSVFLYRRSNWLGRIFVDDELYQFIATHIVDTCDAMLALAQSERVLFHQDHMYVLDLGAMAPPEADRGPGELARMERATTRLSEHELGHKAWQLAQRSTVVFKSDGSNPSPITPRPSSENRALTGLGKLMGTVEESPHRWLADQTQVRVFGTGREHLHIKLWVQRANLFSTPTVSFSIDGTTIAEGTPDRDGYVIVDAPATCNGWCDLYIVFNTRFDWWIIAEQNAIAELFEFDWAAL